MNSASKIAALLLLTAFLAGCRHRTKVMPPQVAQAPALPVSTLANNTPPTIPPAQLPDVEPPSTPTTVAEEQKPKPKKHFYRRPHHTTIEPAPLEKPTAAPAPPEQAANAPPPAGSPIGQLSPAGDSTNLPRRKEILAEIDSTQKGLDNITRHPLTKEEQTTVAQIKAFLEKAKIALSSADLDGANTLVTKAKVLLDEIAKS